VEARANLTEARRLWAKARSGVGPLEGRRGFPRSIGGETEIRSRIRIKIRRRGLRFGHPDGRFGGGGANPVFDR